MQKFKFLKNLCENIFVISRKNHPGISGILENPVDEFPGAPLAETPWKAPVKVLYGTLVATPGKITKVSVGTTPNIGKTEGNFG